MVTLWAFSQIYVENQEKRSQQNDLKLFELSHKGSFSKAVDWKNTSEEILVAEKEQIRKYGLRAWQESAGFQALQPQNCKSISLCFEKKAAEYHIPEWWQPREFVSWNWIQSTQQSKYLTPITKRDGSLATDPAGSRSWHYLCDTGFRCMQNVRVAGPGRLPPRFQKKARQCDSEREVCEAKNVADTTNVWRNQKHGLSEKNCKKGTGWAQDRGYGTYSHRNHCRGEAT